MIPWLKDAERRFNLGFWMVGAGCAATAMFGEGLYASAS
jgi:hypothetical protein